MKEIGIYSNLRRLPAWPKAGLACLYLLQFATALPAAAVLESGIYRTAAGATVEELSGSGAGSSRVIPFSATLMFDLEGAEPTLTAVLSNAVLERGPPFVLTVRSEYGAHLPDGTYLFRGDYLADIQPSGTQYGFEWRFSTAPDGRLVWNGVTGWAGGHIWQITIADILIAPDLAVFGIDIAQADSKITLSWHSILAGYRLEQSASLLPSDWNPVANPVKTVGEQLSVALDIIHSPQFFRLSKP